MNDEAELFIARPHKDTCPQPHCWGPWILDSDDKSATLYEEKSGTYMRLGLWWPDPDSNTMNPALTSLAFLVHVSWAGPRFVSGLLYAYRSIYKLADYEPTLAKMTCKERDIRRMVKEAIDNPVNLRHIRSLSDVERTHHHLNMLAEMPSEERDLSQQFDAGPLHPYSRDAWKDADHGRF